MALPNKQFWVNWNARNYNAATHTIAKEAGQLFNEDLVLHTSATYTDTYVTINSANSRILFNFNSTADNPFNRTANTATMTFIAKTRSTNTHWFVSNRTRDTHPGWMIRQGTPKYQMAYVDDNYYYSSSTAPMIFGWRNGNGTIQYISYTDNVTGTPYSNTSWVGSEQTIFTVFGGAPSSVQWTGDFYWLYISPEVLTDAEIEKVIAYNEGIADTFEPSQDTFAFDYAGGSETFTVTADNAWTCTTPTDFTISPISGNPGTTTVTITAPNRLATTTDTVTFTDSQSNTFDISISQSVGTITPNLTLYQGANTVKKMYHGDGLVYRKMAHSPSLVISGDSFTFPPTSYTAATVVVTTDANWSYSTEASWLQLTKTGNNLEIVPTSDWDQGSAPRTATVTVTADNGFITKSAEISVKQSNTNVTNVDWVWVENQSSGECIFLDTGIYPTVNTSFRVKYIPIRSIGGVIVGFGPAGNGSTPTGSTSDNNDYRFFRAQSINYAYWDFNSNRINRDMLTTDADGYITAECGNNYVTDVNSGYTYNSTAVQTSMATTGVPIYLNLSNDLKVQSLEIWDDGTKVYDGHAAWDGENYGWSDSISGTFSTTTYGGYALTGAPVPDLTDYLCFTAEQANSTVGMMNYRTDASIDTPVLYYSRDKVMWSQWDYSPITLANVGDKLYIYGNNPSGIGIDVNNYSTFQITGSVAASGDATTLITQNGTQILTNSTFHSLFKGCTALTSAPSLPATTLAPGCYSLMFFGCTSLTAAPALPATTLQDGCYDGMFYGCTRLATAPALPATTLVQYCYAGMFHGCTSLTTAPELPATTLVNNCYYGMFEGCTRLNYAKAAIMVWNTNDAYLWASNVASTGTVLVPTGSDIVAKGCNPPGWTVSYY